MSVRDLIENSEAFKKLDTVRQIVTKKKDNMNYLKDNFIIAKTIGIDKWLNQCHTTEANRNIIKELIEKHHEI